MLDKNTPVGKGVRTALQAIVGVVIGLVAAVWAVPGVPEVVQQYLLQNVVVVLLVFVGIPSGVVAYFQNKKGL